jgi:ribosomal protein S18 acetylase RimI-like enzyme
VGRALLEHRLAAIDAPAYLEAATDRAAALYRRLGFVDLGRFSGRHMPALGMWRPAP